MNAREARRLLLVQGFEQSTDAVWSKADGVWATAEARRIEGASASTGALLARRAELAARRLGERDPSVGRWLDGVALPGWALSLALAATFAFGLMLDGLGGQARINLLSLPLLGLLAWNLAVYALLGLQSLRTLAGPLDRPSRPQGLRDALAHGVLWIGLRAAGARSKLPAPARFHLAWARAAGPLHAARAATALHALAAMLALGLVAGLYLRGLAFEYRAGWESTLLDARGVHTLVQWLLGPASALIGTPLPGLDAFSALRFPASAGENAAPWIHRIAVTVLLFVVLPRGVLAAVGLRQSLRLSQDLPLDLRTPYFERLSRELAGRSLSVRVQPYAHRLTPERESALLRQLSAASGGEVQARIDEPLAYGSTLAEREENTVGGTQALDIAVFSASATPEAEVHGEFLRAWPAGTRVLIDETDLRQRLTGPDAAARLEQRRRAWRAMLEAQGRTPVFVDLDAAASDDAPAALIDALQTPEVTP